MQGGTWYVLSFKWWKAWSQYQQAACNSAVSTITDEPPLLARSDSSLRSVDVDIPTPILQAQHSTTPPQTSSIVNLQQHEELKLEPQENSSPSHAKLAPANFPVPINNEDLIDVSTIVL